MTTGRTWIAPALALLAACSREPAETVRPTVRDSAGVAIVENVAPAWGEGRGYRVAPRPLLDLGGVAGDSALDFAGITGAARFANGRIAVANSGTGEIRIFDDRGVFVRRLGGRGRGPGEFEGLGWLQRLPGDSLAAWDGQLRRLTVFGPDGRAARTMTLTDSTASMQAAGVLGTGEVVAVGAPAFMGEAVPAGVHRMRVPLYGVAPDGRRRPLGETWSDEVYLRRGAARYATLVRLPFGRDLRLAAWRGGYLTGDGTRYELAVYGPDGRLRRSIRRTASRLPVTPADIERFVTQVGGAARNASQRETQERFWRTVPFPDSMPAVGDIRVGPNGDLWVEEPQPFGAPTSRRAVFAPDGRWLGVLPLPDRFTLLDVGGNYVLGAWRDADDVEHLRLYALNR